MRLLETLRPEWRSQGAIVHAALEYARANQLGSVEFEPDSRLQVWVPGDWRSDGTNGSMERLAGQLLAALRTEARAARVERSKVGMFEVIPILIPETMTAVAKHRAFGRGLSRAEALGELARKAVPEVTHQIRQMGVPPEQMRPQFGRHNLAILEGWEEIQAVCKPLRLDPDTALILKMDEVQRRRRPA